ncbi:hypothetical protein FGSG_13325 [Fusarium graminearum PH-1]|uniref:hypothetical protein n=1 Tax=Gibberella zeae (strain ATCC MYA-4620 / CBS 123657 / FGSC 9075 / NRRL 31084 / PH-1) TaxID=229533 RepID=UPI00021F1EEC|nr:hypothetical protein FGSG_13325 [Fusarium graminearum PH-1]ESU14675.1 hypothetical protein FGSG_13325 [Fusarium graminearum PH-1]|eukprot:XP_011320100.1 hypothetical protein FGSG_13325 [Fusarium graminearum PH-1]
MHVDLRFYSNSFPSRKPSNAFACIAHDTIPTFPRVLSDIVQNLFNGNRTNGHAMPFAKTKGSSSNKANQVLDIWNKGMSVHVRFVSCRRYGRWRFGDKFSSKLTFQRF